VSAATPAGGAQAGGAPGPARCNWANGPFLEPYHDTEWGVPVHDDRRHFEFLVLESAQAGLSWITILKRRDGYRRAFCDFDPDAVAALGPQDVERLLGDAGIIRNRRKVQSAISNARAFLEIRREFGSFDSYIWGFVNGAPLVNSWGSGAGIPAETALSKEVSGDLRRRGFTFLGPVVCYAHLQATGLVMDHVTSCFRWAALAGGPASAQGLESGGEMP
jgi:DNA-3-methyladenine glycosylase I